MDRSASPLGTLTSLALRAALRLALISSQGAEPSCHGDREGTRDQDGAEHEGRDVGPGRHGCEEGQEEGSHHGRGERKGPAQPGHPIMMGQSAGLR